MLTDAQMWQVIVGFLSATFLIPMVQQRRWSSGLRSFVTFAWCLGAAMVTTYVQGGYAHLKSPHAVMSAMFFVFVTAIGAYKGFAQYHIAPAIERATSPAANSPAIRR